MKTLIPAYGLDYKSAGRVREAYHQGKDFILCDISSPYDGKYCSCRDFPREKVLIRYHNKQKVVLVEPKKSDFGPK